MPTDFGSVVDFAVTLAVILAVAVIAAVILAIILAVIFTFVRTQLLRRLHRLYRFHGFHRLHRGYRVFPETGQRARLNVAILDAPSDLFCSLARFISLAYGSLHPTCDPPRGFVRPTHGFLCPTLLVSYAHVSSFSPLRRMACMGT